MKLSYTLRRPSPSSARSPHAQRRGRSGWRMILLLMALGCGRSPTQGATRAPPPLPSPNAAAHTNVAPATATQASVPPSRAGERAPTQATDGAAPLPNREGEGPAAALRGGAKGYCAIGVGVGAPLDFEQDITFADAIKVARAMEPAQGVSADEHGWLRGDGSILVWAGNSHNRGTYKLKYDGKAEVSIELAQGALSEAKYDAESDSSTREVRLASDQDTLKLTFHNTTAGVRNVKLMRPLQHGADSAHGFEETWYRPMKRIHERFAWLRTMDFTATNGQNVVAWRDRTKPGRFSQQNMVEGTWWQGRGAAWEYAVHMANEERKDLWISVPLLADAHYVENLARLIRYGSDGNEPYSSPQKDPVWPPLRPDLNVYVEYSNEIWNFGFPQWTQLLERTKEEVGKGGSNLNFDGTQSDGDWNTRHWARRLVEISKVFRGVFGDAAMMTRVRPVFSTQLGWADNYLYQGLWFMDAWYNNGDGQNHVPDPHPVNYYVWGAGGSTYPVGYPEQLEHSKSLTVAKIFQGYKKMLGPWSENQKRDVDYARAFGLKRISYEGGPGLDNKGGDEFEKANAAKFASQRDARIKQVYLDMLARYAELGGDGFTNFLTANPTHGVVASYDAAGGSSPKAQALDRALSVARPEPTWGVQLPATLWAGRYRVASHQSTGAHDQAMDFDARTWLSYTVRSATRQRYRLRVVAGSAAADGQLAIWVDGQLAGTLRIPNTGAPAQHAESEPLDFELAPGQHGIRLDGVSGTFSVKQLVIERAAQ